MFQILIYPSSGACDCVVELPHQSFCSRFVVCWRFDTAECECARVAGWSCASSCNTGTTQTKPHQISNTQRTENKTTDVVIQQRSRRLLMMDILMSETCCAHKKWNKIASDIKLVFYSSANIHFWSHLPQLFLELNMFQKKGVEKPEAHILRSVNFFPRKSCRLWDNVEKCRAGRAAGDNMAQAHCMLGTYGYRHTQYVFRIALPPLQQWLHERTSQSRYTYTACLVLISCSFTNQSLAMGRLQQVQSYVKEKKMFGAP